jgi:hypothetical protein
MLIAWWVVTIEIPGRNLFLIAEQRGLERAFAPISVWAFEFTSRMTTQRVWAAVIVIAAVLLHRWLWVRREKWDAWGKWLFKAGFVVLYIALYGLFLLTFFAAELPIWFWPKNL